MRLNVKIKGKEDFKMEFKVVYNQKDERAKLAKRLCDKVKAEHEEWRTKIRKSTKRQIFENSHNIVLFENIVYVVEHKLGHLRIDDLLTLLSFKNTLMEIRLEWLSSDSSLIGDLSETITDLATMYCGGMEVAA
jgi:hypothetical protein